VTLSGYLVGKAMTWAQGAGAETSLSPGSLFQSSRQVWGPIRDGPSKGLLFQISGPSRPGGLVAPIALVAVGSEAFRHLWCLAFGRYIAEWARRARTTAGTRAIPWVIRVVLADPADILTAEAFHVHSSERALSVGAQHSRYQTRQQAGGSVLIRTPASEN
jgi:hypothetical protein